VIIVYCHYPAESKHMYEFLYLRHRTRCVHVDGLYVRACVRLSRCFRDITCWLIIARLLTVVHYGADVLGLKVDRSKVKVTGWPDARCHFEVCFRDIYDMRWCIFSKVLSLMRIRTKIKSGFWDENVRDQGLKEGKWMYPGGPKSDSLFNYVNIMSYELQNTIDLLFIWLNICYLLFRV